MSTLEVRKINGEIIKSVEINSDVFQQKGTEYNIQQVVRQFLAGRHRGTHKTKTRSEVKGSRRKLFKQKGTGNARAGDAKSPIRRHGGVAFGPVVRSYDLKVNKKVKQKALSAVLNILIEKKRVFILDSMELEKPKTKQIVQLLKDWKLKKTLFISHDKTTNFGLACRNLPNVKFVKDVSLNIYDMLKHKNSIFTEQALSNIEKRILK